jgi:hypothetical protein
MIELDLHSIDEEPSAMSWSLRNSLCISSVPRYLWERHSPRGTEMPQGTEATQSTFEQIPYDRLTLVGKESGNYDSKEYIYHGQLGVYRLRVGESVTDEGKVFYIYQNNKFWLNLYPSDTKRVFVGRDDDDYYIFRFEGKYVSVFKRKYDI